MPVVNTGNRQELLDIGIDLCSDYSQISYFDRETGEPKSISTTIGEEKFQIPSVLFQKVASDKWYFGEEALRLSLRSEGILIPKLIELCSKKDGVVVNGETFKPYQLLSIYIRRLLNLLTFEGIKEPEFGVITVTLEQNNKELMDAVKMAIMELTIPCKKIRIEDHKESFFHYVLSLSKELYANDILLIEYGEKEYKTYHLSINKKIQPHLISIKETQLETRISCSEMRKSDFSNERKEELDVFFQEQCKKLLQNLIVSSVFLVGNGFEYGWAKKSLHTLCAGRRVFQGKNLYCKGACFASTLEKEKATSSNYLYLNDNKVKYNIGFLRLVNNQQEFYTVLSAGADWFKSRSECEVILDEVDFIELKMLPFDNTENRTVIVPLTDLPNRPNKTIRLKLEIYFETANKAIFILSDCGFGEFYPSTNKTWRHEIML